jgi:hypothetical protein
MVSRLIFSSFSTDGEDEVMKKLEAATPELGGRVEQITQKILNGNGFTNLFRKVFLAG